MQVSLLLRFPYLWFLRAPRRRLAIVLAGVAALAFWPLNTLAAPSGTPGPKDPFWLASAPSMGPPAVAVDDQGFSHIVWTERNRAYYRKVSEQARYAAAGWDVVDPGLPGADPAAPPEPEPLEIYNALPALQAKVATDRAGNAHVVVWSQGHAFSGLVYIKVGANGTKQVHKLLRMRPLPSGDVQYSWPGIAIDPVTDLPVVTTIAQVTNHTPASIDYDPVGLPFLFVLFPIYTPAITTCSEYVVALRLDDAGTVESQHVFSSERQNGYLPYRSEAPAVAVDSGGRLHAVWRHCPAGGSPRIVYRDSDHPGGGLDSRDSLSARFTLCDTVDSAARPAIVRDSFDELHVVWQTGAATCAYVRLNPDGPLDYQASPASRLAVVTGPPALAVGDDGTVRVVWEDGRNGEDEIYFAAIGGDTREPMLPPAAVDAEDCRLTFSGGTAFAPAIGLSPWGWPSIVWKDTENSTAAGGAVSYSLAKYRPPWTWLLYVNGDNELAESCLAALSGFTGTVDVSFPFPLGLEEMAYLPLARVVVQYDGPGAGDTRRFLLGYDGNRSEDYAALSDRYQVYLGRACWYVGPAGAGTDPAAAEANMADPGALRNFLSWARVRYPGGQTLLSVIGPGNGWLPGTGAGAREDGGTKAILSDQNGTPANPADDSSMGMKALRLALDNAGQPFHYDLLFLDASCSGLLEVAYQVRPYADLLMLSQGSSVPGPYGSYLAAAGTSPSEGSIWAPAPESPTTPQDLAKAIVRSYDLYCREEELTGRLRRHTLSALATSRIEPLAVAVDQLVAEADGLLAFPDLKQAYLEAWTESQRTDEDGRYTDLWSFCSQLGLRLGAVPELATLQDRIQAIKDLIAPVDDARLVVANGHDDLLMRECRGLSIYFPFSRTDIAINGVSESQEETVGAFIPKSAASRAVETEKLGKVQIIFPPERREGILTLSRSNANLDIYWMDPGSDALHPVLPAGSYLLERPWDLATEADEVRRIRDRLWARGRELGVCELTLSYKPPGGQPPPPPDVARATIVRLDLDIDANNDGPINEADEAFENTPPGRLVGLNDDDDDNENGDAVTAPEEVDNADTGMDGLADLDDLVPLILCLDASGLPLESMVVISVDNPAFVRIFDPFDPSRSIIGPTTTASLGAPVASWETTLGSLLAVSREVTFLIEGVASGQVTITCTLRAPNRDPIVSKTVLATVGGLDLDINVDDHPTLAGIAIPTTSAAADITAADEALEVDRGGYLWVNDDNDHNTGAADAVLDRDDRAVYADDDLERVRVRVPDSIWGAGCTVRLQCTFPAGLRVWKQNKRDELVLGTAFASAATFDTDTDGTLWLEGLAPGAGVLSLQILHGTEVRAEDRIQVTVFAVGNVEWQSDGDSVVEADIAPVGAGQRRIFPDRTTADDTLARDRPRVTVTLTPPIPPGSGWHLPVACVARDVDHYANADIEGRPFDAAAASNDAEGHDGQHSPNDNRTGFTGSAEHNGLFGEAGSGDVYNLGIAVESVADDTVVSSLSGQTACGWAEAIGEPGTGKAVLHLTEHTPCNNWRVAAGCAGALDIPGGSHQAVRINNLATDGVTLEYINDTALTVGGGAGTASRSSLTLTVWRRLHLELDHMAAVNFQQSASRDEWSVQDGDITGPGAVGANALETTCDARFAHQWLGGLVRFYDNGLFSRTFLGAGQITGNTSGADSTVRFAVAPPADADYLVLSDDDVQALGDAPPGTAVARVARAVADTTLYNQDAMLHAAAIHMLTDTGQDSTDSPFLLNVEDANAPAAVATRKGLRGGEDYWVATVCIAYQGGVAASGDGAGTSWGRGISIPYWHASATQPSEGGFLVFVEGVKDWVTELPVSPADTFLSRLQRTTLHECGHVLGGFHGEGGLMRGGDETPSGTSPTGGGFSGRSLRRFMLLRNEGPGRP